MRVLLFSDNYGTPLTLRYLPPDCLVGIVGAAIRPQYHSLLESQALASGVPFLVQPKRNDPRYNEFLGIVRNLSPELLLVNSYSMLLGAEILTLASLGGVNVHGALLPQYRGANPVQWALINNEVETGVTIHRLTPELDAGEAIAQRRVSIQLSDTWLDVQARIAAATDGLLHDIMPRLLEGHLQGTPQDERHARHHPRRTPEDGRIDWRQSVLRIYNLIRALVRPHPGAFYDVSGVRHVIDTHKSLAEITAMKISVGTLRLEEEGVTLHPLTDRAGAFDNVWFAVVAGPRRAKDSVLGLTHLDYRSRSAQLEAEGSTHEQGLLARAATLLGRYAAQELELSRLDAKGGVEGSLADAVHESLSRQFARRVAPSSGVGALGAQG